MARYPNGRIPDSELVTFETGWNSAEGTWKHQLTPGTYQKHLKLVALAKARTGRTLTIGPGWGAYRPIASQEYARKLYGTGAAVVGTSSHGGNWYDGPRGWRESMAMDYDNWGWVYDWDRAAFYEDVRAAGLTPGLIHPSRGNGYPDEPWHVVDLDPWAPPTGGKSASNYIESEEDDMKLIRWNDKHFFVVGRETVYYVGNPGWVPYLGDHYGPVRDVDDEALTVELVVNAVPWGAVDAVLKGAAFGGDGRHWSRLQAEGETIRGGQAVAQKTLADVLATAKQISG